eukprot:545149-Amorphochlora_amoeboformis.AAC.1
MSISRFLASWGDSLGVEAEFACDQMAPALLDPPPGGLGARIDGALGLFGMSRSSWGLGLGLGSGSGLGLGLGLDVDLLSPVASWGLGLGLGSGLGLGLGLDVDLPSPVACSGPDTDLDAAPIARLAAECLSRSVLW